MLFIYIFTPPFQTFKSFFWFHSNSFIIRPGFLPIGKHPLFPPGLSLSAILCGPGLSSACGQKYPPMAPLVGTGHRDHRHTALKIQSSSATAPLHSFISTVQTHRDPEMAKNDAMLSYGFLNQKAVYYYTALSTNDLLQACHNFTCQLRYKNTSRLKLDSLHVAWEKFIESRKAVSPEKMNCSLAAYQTYHRIVPPIIPAILRDKR